MKRKHWIIAGLAVGLIGMILVGKCYRSQANEWEKQVRVVLSQAEDLDRQAKEAVKRADNAEAEIEILVESVRDKQPIIRERIDSVRVETPLELAGHPAIVKRDEIIADLIVESADWEEAYEREVEVANLLRVANAFALARGDSLVRVLEDRPKKHPWYIPRLGVGPYAGIDMNGKPSVGPIAVHLAWEIKF